MLALLALAVAAAVTAAAPTGFRLDVAVMAIAAVAGLFPTAVAVVAGGLVVILRHHAEWHAAGPWVIGVFAGVGSAAVLRRPRTLDQVPSRTALRLLVLVAGAAVLGFVENAIEFAEFGNLSLEHAALAGARLLCGALVAAAILWRPRRGTEATPLFVATTVAGLTIALVIATIGFWQQQDEDLLHATSDASSNAFLSALADEMNVISTKASTSSTESFTPLRFPALLQTVVFGHSAMPAAQLVEWSPTGAHVLASLSSLGGDFERAFAGWTESADVPVSTAANTGVLSYLGLAALPRPSNSGSDAYLVYGTKLLAPPGAAGNPSRLLVVALSVGVMVDSSVAPTLAANGEAIVRVYAERGDEHLLLWATDDADLGSTDAAPGTFVTAAPPDDRRASQAVTPVTLNDSQFLFAAIPGQDFGTPTGLRRVVIWLELIAGLVIVGFVLAAGDQRARRERDRLRREALLAAALQGSPGWTAIVDLNDLVVMSNGYRHGAAQGTPVSHSALWADDAAAVDDIRGLLMAARRGEAGVMQHVWSDPSDTSHAMRIVEITARPLPDPALTYLQCVDVTEHRDRAMRTAQSERMEAIGVLAGGLAHDFNNLLFITLGYLQMLERQQMVTDDEQSSMYVGRAIEAVERGAVVAKSLLSFARSQPLTAVPVNLRQFVVDLEPLIEQALGSAHRLEIHADGDDLDVVVDPGRLSSSLLNAVFNARDAMDGRGVVQIRIDRCIAAPVGGEPTSAIFISVTDSGRGMSPEVASRAFEPFFTTKQLGSGTGLGLSTLYSFAQQSGGWAAIDSTEGAGTTVTLYLPPAVDLAVDATPTRMPRAATRALVVDDEATLADLVAGWLEDLGMETRVATDPDQAQRLAESFRPELLVSDANLGASIDGLELARILVQRDPALLVVFMTGFSERIRALQSAGVATLAKPFSRDDLLLSLTTHLGDRLASHSGRETNP